MFPGSRDALQRAGIVFITIPNLWLTCRGRQGKENVRSSGLHLCWLSGRSDPSWATPPPGPVRPVPW